MIKAKPQAVIFDWDGTLVNTIPGLRKAHNHVRTSLGHDPWTESEFRANLKHSSRELYPEIYGDKVEQAYEYLYDYIDRHHIDMLEVLEGAEALVSWLHEAEVPMALVSNKTHDYLLKEVAHLEWESYFFCALGAGQAARDKPAPDPLYMALNAAMTPLDAGKTWFIGDTETDLMASQAAQCRSVLMLHGENKDDLRERYKPDYAFENCKDLHETLRGIVK